MAAEKERERENEISRNVCEKQMKNKIGGRNENRWMRSRPPASNSRARSESRHRWIRSLTGMTDRLFPPSLFPSLSLSRAPLPPIHTHTRKVVRLPALDRGQRGWKKKKITKSNLNQWSIERRFDIAEGYLCSFERKPRWIRRRKDTGLREEGRDEGSLRGNGWRSRGSKRERKTASAGGETGKEGRGRKRER